MTRPRFRLHRRSPPGEAVTRNFIPEPCKISCTDLAADPAAWAALLTLIAMEVVLGIDNLIFISILTNKLPPEQQRSRARTIGIGLALIMRLALLGTVALIVQLTDADLHRCSATASPGAT